MRSEHSSLKRQRTLRNKAAHRTKGRRPKVKKSDRGKAWAQREAEWLS